MNRPHAQLAVQTALFLLATVVANPGVGHCGESGPAVASPAAQEGDLQVQDVVTALDPGNTARLLVLLARYPRLPEAILTADGVTSLGYAAATGNTDALGALLEVQPPLDGQDRLMRSALYLAIANARDDAALLLIAAGANVRLSDDQGVSPLHLAAKSGRALIASALLSHGADVNAGSVRGTAPLAVAAYFGHLSVVRLLAAASADINRADVNGVTALHCAAQSQKLEVARYLLEQGAMPGARDSDGMTPAHWARQAGDRDMEALLTAAGEREAPGAGRRP